MLWELSSFLVTLSHHSSLLLCMWRECCTRAQLAWAAPYRASNLAHLRSMERWAGFKSCRQEAAAWGAEEREILRLCRGELKEPKKSSHADVVWTVSVQLCHADKLVISKLVAVTAKQNEVCLKFTANGCFCLCSMALPFLMLFLPLWSSLLNGSICLWSWIVAGHFLLFCCKSQISNTTSIQKTGWLYISLSHGWCPCFWLYILLFLDLFSTHLL